MLTPRLCAADASHERSRFFMKQWICGANPHIKFTDKGMAYNLNAGTYLATQTSVFLASIYGECCSGGAAAANCAESRMNMYITDVIQN